MRNDSMPRKTLWWGVGLSVGGAILTVTAPPLLAMTLPLDTTAGQTAFFAFETAFSVIRQLALPLGAVLIGAALVMSYVDRRLRDEGIGDRPKRWLLPDARATGSTRDP